MLSRFLASLLIIPLALISGCGGGGGDSSTSSASNSAGTNTGQLAYEGLWLGNYVNAGSGGTSLGLVFINQNNELFSLSESQPRTIGPKTFEIGNLKINGTSFAGSGLKTASSQIPFSAIDLKYRDPTIQGLNYNTYYLKISGSIIGNSGLSIFYNLADNNNYNLSMTAISNTLYNYNKQASINDLGKSWSIYASNLSAVLDGYKRSAININADGTFSSTDSTCNFSGKFTPNSSGKNYFNVSLTTAASNCSKPNSAFSGVGIVFTAIDGEKRIVIATYDATKQYTAFITN
jgi:hypothetical protein